jgi:hypothetical protein
MPVWRVRARRPTFVPQMAGRAGRRLALAGDSGGVTR